MDRVFESGAAGLAPAAPASPSTGYPTGGDPGGGVPATKPGPYWFHMVTEELRAVVVAAGLTPSHTVLNQVALAISALVASAGVSSYSATQALPASDLRKTVLFAGGAANATFTLPALSGVAVGASITIKHATAGAFVLTVQRAGTDVIQPGGSTINSFTMLVGDCVTLVNSGSGWAIVNGSTLMQFATGQFGSSLGPNGWQRLPSGLILQWGFRAGVGPSSGFGQTFNIGFPNACVHVNYILSASSGAANANNIANNIDQFGFIASNQNGSTVTMFWFALGY